MIWSRLVWVETIFFGRYPAFGGVGLCGVTAASRPAKGGPYYP